MTDVAASVIVPRNKDEERILEVLNRLKSGGYLGRIDTFGMLRPIANEARRNIGELVSQSRKEGPRGNRVINWVVAPRGGGKTEALAAIERSLLVENYLEGSKKSIVVPVDLKEISQRTTGPGLQAVIFEKATTTSSSPFKQKIDEFTQNLTGESPTQKIRENVIGLGVDVGLTLANVSVPGVGTGISLLGTGLLNSINRRLKFREKNIHKMLRAKGITSPDALTLLTLWIKYSYQPDQEKWDKLNRVFQRLAEKETLFHILCFTLQATGYSTVVLLFDEVDQLVGGTNLTRALERLWDPPKESDLYNHKVTIFFILAGTAKINDLKNEDTYAGFSRRFMGAKTVPVTTYNLKPPSIQEDLNANDDCAHAINKIKELLGNLVDAPSRTISQAKELELRKSLADQSHAGKLTWYDLWAAVCKEYSLQ